MLFGHGHFQSLEIYASRGQLSVRFRRDTGEGNFDERTLPYVTRSDQNYKAELCATNNILKPRTLCSSHSLLFCNGRRVGPLIQWALGVATIRWKSATSWPLPVSRLWRLMHSVLERVRPFHERTNRPTEMFQRGTESGATCMSSWPISYHVGPGLHSAGMCFPFSD